MSIAPDLFDSITPPGIWITISEPVSGEADDRAVTVRVKPAGGRSLTVTLPVSRYSPEASIVRACGQYITYLEGAQAAVGKERALGMFRQAIDDWVEPF